MAHSHLLSPITYLLGIARLLVVIGIMPIVTATVHAQHDYDIWHFGKGRGLDFRGGSPVLIDTTPCSTLEGSAVMCDRTTGEFLFGAAGGSIYDRRGVTMPQGDSIIDGGYTSTQGDLIVPDPCNVDRYYVFTVDQCGYAGLHQGMYFSVVDMAANGGFGAVVLRNQRLLPTASEHLTAVMHANGHDYWIVAHSRGGRSFYAFLVSGAGVSMVPVESIVGTEQGSPTSSGLWPLGYLKSSPDGRRLALAAMYIGLLELYDFDPATGLVSNALRLLGNSFPSHVDDGLHYGVSFSPDGRLLYAGINRMDYTNYRLMQWSLEPNIGDSITRSALVVADNSIAPSRALLALQTGPDGKIYAMMSDGWVGVIERPNERGFWCGFRERLVRCFVPGADPSEGVMGLPNNIDDRRFFARPLPQRGVRVVAVDYRGNCYGADVTAAPGYLSYRWSHGDSGRTIRVTSSGRYIVSAIDSNGCTSVDSIDVVTDDAIDVVIDAGGPLEFCEEDSVQLTARTLGSVKRITWSVGDTTPVITARTDGLYVVTVQGYGDCTATDTIAVRVNPRQRIIGHIDSATVSRPGDTLSLTLHLDSLRDDIIGEMILVFVYDTTIMRPLHPEEQGEMLRMTSGTLIDGWLVSTNTERAGRIELRLVPQLPAHIVSTSGALLRLRFTTYASIDQSGIASLAVEIPFALQLPGTPCSSVVTEPGLVQLLLCGAEHRAMAGLQSSYALDEPRPNPFNPTTAIDFTLGLDGSTRLEILDAAGRIVATLVNAHLSAGMHSATWDAHAHPSGLYYCRLISGDWIATTTMVVVK